MPIHKSDKLAALPFSYRPVALLSSLSKVYEEILLRRLQVFVDDNGLLRAEQFGFRKGHSCID